MAITMRELARMAGVSLATVSLALRDHPRISPEVRERVKRLADEAGYRPNPVVSTLIAQVRASRTTTYQSTIGAVLTLPLKDCLEVHTFRDWLSSCKGRAQQLGYGFDVFSMADAGFTPERLAKVLDARRIQGVVAFGPFPAEGIPADFDRVWHRSAVVILGERPEKPALSCVLNNQFATARLAFEELLRRGYRRPALCLSPALDEIVEHRFLGGFLVAQQRLPAEDRIAPFPFAADGYQAFAAWLKNSRPDAIITLHRDIRDWVGRAGLSVPSEVGLVHLDWSPRLEGWAGTDQNNDQVGCVAIDMLVGQLHRNEVAPPPFQKCMFIHSQWRDGETVAPPQ